MKVEIPPPSWEVFAECNTCYTQAQKPCFDLRSKSKNFVELTMPHRGRRRFDTGEIYS